MQSGGILTDVRSSGSEQRRVMLQVILNERRDEVKTVIVAFVPAQLERKAALCTGGFEQFRFELLGEEIIPQALIDEDLAKDRRVTDLTCDFARVVVMPG